MIVLRGDRITEAVVSDHTRPIEDEPQAEQPQSRAKDRDHLRPTDIRLELGNSSAKNHTDDHDRDNEEAETIPDDEHGDLSGMERIQTN